MKVSKYPPAEGQAAVPGLQVGREDESPPLLPTPARASEDFGARCPASETALAEAAPRSRAAASLLALLDVPGVLIWMAVLALVGGAWIHSSVERLPESYSWSLPLQTLRNVIAKASLPLWALMAYLVGLGQSRGWRVTGRVIAGALERWRGLGPRALTTIRPRTKLALLIATSVLLLDGVLFPSHRWLGSLAMSIAAFIAASRMTRQKGANATLNVIVGVAVFTAVCYWFTIVKTLTFAGRVQWDAEIVAFERAISGVYPHRWLVAIFAQHTSSIELMDRVYFAIFEHMVVAASFLVGVGDVRERDRYLGALCFCYVLGAPLYLCMPAAGPAYFDPSAYAFLSQQPLIVNHAQAVLFDNTAAVNEGRARVIQTWGYIACMPSLHMAHEFVMLYFARRSPVFFVGTLTFFVLTAVAVVALGWHYPTDILAGVLLGVIGIVISRYTGHRLFPRALRSNMGVQGTSSGR